MKSQIVHGLIVILCASLCGAVHLLQHRDVGINSMSDLNEGKDVHKQHSLLAFWDVMLCYIASSFDVLVKS